MTIREAELIGYEFISMSNTEIAFADGEGRAVTMYLGEDHIWYAAEGDDFSGIGPGHDSWTVIEGQWQLGGGEHEPKV